MKARSLSFLATASLLALPFLFSSCANPNFLGVTELSTLPPELPRNSTPEEIRIALGEPSWTESVGGPGQRTHVWHYTDLWHDDKGFGSWEIYFQEVAQPKSPDGPDIYYAGWRLVDPTSGETPDRESFHLPRR